MPARLFVADACALEVVDPVSVGVWRWVWGLAPVVALAALLVMSSSAFGALSRPETGSFGPDGTSATAFTGVKQLTIRQSTGRLYVHDGGANKIHGFDVTSGATQPPIGGSFPIDVPDGGGVPDVAVDNSAAASAGNLYFLSESSGLYGFTAAGAARAGNFPVARSDFGDPCGAEVDPSGDVWVGDYGTQSIKRFDAAGVLQGSIDVSAQGAPCDVAFDANGDLYVGAFYGPTYKYTAASLYTDPTQVDGGTTVAVTVDRATHQLYVVHPDRVSVYDAAGTFLYDFAQDISDSSLVGAAIDEASDRVYVSERTNNRVHVFGSPVVTARATTNDATSVAASTATLNGSVDPGSRAVLTCHFEYGESTDYGQTADCVPAAASLPADSTEHAVIADVTGLTAEQTYHARLVITNSQGTFSGGDVTFTTQPAVNDLSTAPATDITGTAATLNGTLDPDGTEVTSCRFSYIAESAADENIAASRDPFDGAATADCSPSPNSEAGETAVSARVTGLEPGAAYRFRLQASNADGMTVGAVETFTTLGPIVSATAVRAVTDTRATFAGSVDPRGESTSYAFQYVTDVDFQAHGFANAVSVPAAAASIGSGATHGLVSERATGLVPGTAYHVRLVATNASATVAGAPAVFKALPSRDPQNGCPNDSLRTGPGAALPDCRAYEQASPVDKHGSKINGSYRLVQAAASGARISFANASGLPTTGGTSSPTTYVASRGAESWTTNGLLAPADPGRGATLLGWDAELSTSVSAVTGAIGRNGLYLGDTGTGAFLRAAPLPPVGHNAYLAGFAGDTSKLIFEDSEVAWTPDAIPGVDNLYQLDHGTVTLAGRIPAGSAATCDDSSGPACVPAPAGSFAGPYAWAEGNSPLGHGGVASSFYTQNTISADGSKVFFTAAGTGQLYVRVNGTTTTRISASQAATPDPHGPQPAVWVASTPDGSKVFFLSCERLTDDSTAASPSAGSGCFDGESTAVAGAGSDLYAYDTSTGRLTDLSVDPDPATDNSCVDGGGTTSGPGCGASVVGLLGTSADGSTAYFAASGSIASGAAPVACREIGGTGCNLYVSQDGKPLAFVTELASGLDGDITNWRPLPVVHANEARVARVAANGTLMFLSNRSLTGFDNTEATGDSSCHQGNASSLQPCRELFRYVPGGSGPACVSCNPAGTRPIGVLGLNSDLEAFGAAPHTQLLSRNISDDGQRVFFETADALVAADTNADSGCPAVAGGPRCTDVYEWEAEGTGSCQHPTLNGGCIYLLSSGKSSEPSFLADVSASGDDAFIFTDEQLVPQDQDQLTDVYDVRVNGGLPSQHPTSPEACTGDACQGPVSAPPPLIVAASVSFPAPGNPDLPGATLPTPAPKVSKAKTVRGARALVSVKVPAAGNITISGKRLKTSHRTARAKGTYRLRVTLTAKARAILKKGHTLKIEAKVLFTPRAGRSSTATVRLTFKTATTKKQGR